MFVPRSLQVYLSNHQIIKFYKEYGGNIAAPRSKFQKDLTSEKKLWVNEIKQGLI